MAGEVNGPRRAVVLAALAVILLLALAVCAAHWVNAVSPRGTARVSDYALLARAPKDAALGEDARALPVYADGERSFALLMEEPRATGGLLIVEGGLLRIDQPVGEVRVRVGLIPVDAAPGAPATRSDEIVLMNTQMVRWDAELARKNGFDDHCGFCATAALKRLPNGQYDVVLLDESDGGRRMIDARVSVILTDGGFGIGRVIDPEEAADE